jgi:hypothetical protein
VPVDDPELAIASGAWKRSTSANGFYRKTSTSTTAQNAALRSSPVVAKQLALVARTCPTCGSVRVLWNGIVVKKISLQASPGASKRVFKIPAFATQQSGTARIEVASQPRSRANDRTEVSPLKVSPLHLGQNHGHPDAFLGSPTSGYVDYHFPR